MRERGSGIQESRPVWTLWDVVRLERQGWTGVDMGSRTGDTRGWRVGPSVGMHAPCCHGTVCRSLWPWGASTSTRSTTTGRCGWLHHSTRSPSTSSPNCGAERTGHSDARGTKGWTGCPGLVPGTKVSTSGRWDSRCEQRVEPETSTTRETDFTGRTTELRVVSGEKRVSLGKSGLTTRVRDSGTELCHVGRCTDEV